MVCQPIALEFICQIGVYLLLRAVAFGEGSFRVLEVLRCCHVFFLCGGKFTLRAENKEGRHATWHCPFGSEQLEPVLASSSLSSRAL